MSSAADQATGTPGDTIPAAATTETATAATSTSTNRRQPFGQGFLDTISTGWADRPETMPPAR
ncbi:hypothetical protein ACWGR3_30905, partial [Streptomyces albidoflavus]